IEARDGDRESIVVSEIPYQVNKARLVEKIAELVRDKRIDGIAQIRDESDRRGMRLVLELKRDAISGVVLNNLFALTPLQTTFGVVLLAIDGGQPRTLNLKEMLERFISHRREVVTRRSRFELRNAEKRLHVVEGLLVAQDIIDLVITIIRRSKDPEEARWGLTHVLSPELYQHATFHDLPRLDLDQAMAQMEQLVARARTEEPRYPGLQHRYQGTGFSEEQAKQILEMRLQRLTGIQREELFTELVALTRDILRLREILEVEASLLEVIRSELKEIREKFGDDRRTEITGDTAAFTHEDLIAEEDMVVTVSHAGYIKRSPLTEYRAQKRGGRGKTGAATKEDDFVTDLFVASTHAYILPITTRGKLYWLKVHEIPQAGRAARGKPIINLVHMAEGEKLASVVVTKGFPENQYIFFVTRKGVVKKTDLSAFSNVRSAGIIALGIEDGDSLVAVRITDGSKDILLSTAQGMSIRFAESEVRSMGRNAYGVKGITLEKDDEVVGADLVEPGTAILTVTENGYGKRTEEAEYRIQGRGGKGIIDIKTTDRNGLVVGAVPVRDRDQIMLVTSAGMLIRMKVGDISVIGRNTQGVRLITLESAGEKVTGLSRLPEEDGNGGGEERPGGDEAPEASSSSAEDDAAGPGGEDAEGTGEGEEP
ncbi:MAG TPA: DNA gyrase C-terminal beta-propeller domain-containing protein, partial [Myxococcaceae bacterium]|nr:DNA gyrase C-terminal beta-propeller domain-containing protein [Myxococcaceae bacterium]